MTGATARRWVGEVADFLLPSRCLGCDDRLAVDGPAEPVCSRCRSRLREPPWPRCRRCDAPSGTGRGVDSGCLSCREWPAALTFARSAVILERPADRLVHALKYEGWKETVPVMVDAMGRIQLPSEARSDPVVVPVPTSRRRRLRRGYNQAELLARELARRAGARVVCALERSGVGGTQVELHASQRRSNVRGVFTPRPALSLAHRHILLVDDVLTTGATASEAASTLERVGASGVTVVTFARALPGRRRHTD